MRNCSFCFIGNVIDGKCLLCGTMHEDDLLLEQELKLNGFDELSRGAQDLRRDMFVYEAFLRKKVSRMMPRGPSVD